MIYDIFISYRRNGGYDAAKHLFDLLSRDNYKVSFDIDTLRNGDFDVELLHRIDQCTDFILILNKGVFDRCFEVDRKEDWLRSELAYALEKGKNIIPIMLTGFTEFPDNLPDDISKVRRKNGPKYDQYWFDAFYDKLKRDFLETKPVVKVAIPNMTAQCTLKIRPNLDCVVFVDDERCAEAPAGKITKIPLNKGTFFLEFVSTENAVDKFIIENYQLDNPEQLLPVDLESVVNQRIEIEQLAKFRQLKNQKLYLEDYQLIELLAQKGNAEAQYNLGEMYYNGYYGVAKDITEAGRWYRKSAEQGNASAQCNLGYMYWHGDGVPKDYTEAVIWFRKSAEQGNADAKKSLKELGETY